MSLSEIAVDPDIRRLNDEGLHAYIVLATLMLRNGRDRRLENRLEMMQAEYDSRVAENYDTP